MDRDRVVGRSRPIDRLIHRLIAYRSTEHSLIVNNAINDCQNLEPSLTFKTFNVGIALGTHERKFGLAFLTHTEWKFAFVVHILNSPKKLVARIEDVSVNLNF